MFGAVFLLARFLQFLRFYSPLEPGLAVLHWTLYGVGMGLFFAPVLVRSDR